MAHAAPQAVQQERWELFPMNHNPNRCSRDAMRSKTMTTKKKALVVSELKQSLLNVVRRSSTRFCEDRGNTKHLKPKRLRMHTARNLGEHRNTQPKEQV